MREPDANGPRVCACVHACACVCVAQISDFSKSQLELHKNMEFCFISLFIYLLIENKISLVAWGSLKLAIY